MEHPNQLNSLSLKDNFSIKNQRDTLPREELLSSNQNVDLATPIKNTENKQSLDQNLSLLVRMVANVTEAHTAIIFLRKENSRELELVTAQTLSKDLITEPEISFGEGLIGWCAENQAKVSVSPFKHDATTLMYYSKEQELKSFLAVPIPVSYTHLTLPTKA